MALVGIAERQINFMEVCNAYQITGTEESGRELSEIPAAPRTRRTGAHDSQQSNPAGAGDVEDPTGRRDSDRSGVVRTNSCELVRAQQECKEWNRFRRKWRGAVPSKGTPEYEEYFRDGKAAHDALVAAIEAVK
jgi:hypothetical protein